VRATYEAISPFTMPSSYYISHLFATSSCPTVKANNSTPCLPPVQTRRPYLQQHRLMRLRMQLRRLVRLLRIRYPSLIRDSLLPFSLGAPQQKMVTSMGETVLVVRNLTSNEKREIQSTIGDYSLVIYCPQRPTSCPICTCPGRQVSEAQKTASLRTVSIDLCTHEKQLSTVPHSTVQKDLEVTRCQDSS
jgi:hypothetical protein